jgi:hypothetical protein
MCRPRYRRPTRLGRRRRLYYSRSQKAPVHIPPTGSALGRYRLSNLSGNAFLFPPLSRPTHLLPHSPARRSHARSTHHSAVPGRHAAPQGAVHRHPGRRQRYTHTCFLSISIPIVSVGCHATSLGPHENMRLLLSGERRTHHYGPTVAAVSSSLSCVSVEAYWELGAGRWEGGRTQGGVGCIWRSERAGGMTDEGGVRGSREVGVGLSGSRGGVRVRVSSTAD